MSGNSINIVRNLPIFLLAALLTGCAPVYLSRQPRMKEGGLVLVRLALKHGVTQSEVGGTDTIFVQDRSHAAAIPPGQSWRVSLGRSGMMISTGTGPMLGPADGPLRFYSKNRLLLDGSEVVGVLEIRPETAGGMLLIMECDLEQYLVGVVSAEMGSGRTELEALKAQAVASRSYALTRIGASPEAGYDIEAGVQHQAYDGSGNAPPMIVKAVEETRGQVLICDGKVAAANFHSTCGGRTAMPSEVWQAEDERFPFLKSVQDNYCKISPRYSWQDTVNAREILDKLFPGQPQARIKNVEILDRSRSGRVQVLKVSADCGDTVLYKDKIRFGLSASPVLSTRFDLKIQRDQEGFVSSIILEGSGYGHGVGLCQWGAIGMAREGSGYKKILRHFYRGIDIESRY